MKFNKISSSLVALWSNVVVRYILSRRGWPGPLAVTMATQHPAPRDVTAPSICAPLYSYCHQHRHSPQPPPHTLPASPSLSLSRLFSVSITSLSSSSISFLSLSSLLLTNYDFLQILFLSYASFLEKSVRD